MISTLGYDGVEIWEEEKEKVISILTVKQENLSKRIENICSVPGLDFFCE